MDISQNTPEAKSQKSNYEILISQLTQFGLFPLLASIIVLLLYIFLAINLVKLSRNYFAKSQNTISPSPTSFPTLVSSPSPIPTTYFSNPSSSPFPTSNPSYDIALPLGDATTAEECLGKGGIWQKWGLAGLEYCQIPATDADKPCTDGSQCSLGGCISKDATVYGRCQKYRNEFGCLSFINAGEISQTFCID
ncbi:hypothetical protein FJY90_04425 [Candidatus Gottesmanbacteria bacterium]|nr:hypothetical protein [Candidatus Gottesmanbacteria bacterium]